MSDENKSGENEVVDVQLTAPQPTQEQGNVKPGRNDKWIILSKPCIVALFVYYALLVVVASAYEVYTLVDLIDKANGLNNNIPIRILDIFRISFSGAIISTGFYYFRKLYKSCLQGKVDSDIKDIISSIGAKAYFFFRPILGAIISVIAIFIVYIGLFFLVDNPSITRDKFFIFVFVMSFLFGFSNGRLIEKLESSKDRIAEQVNFSKGGKE